MACWGIGLLSLHQGDLPRALPLLERAVGICQDADLPVYFPWFAPALGAAYTLGGRVTDAVPLLTRAMEWTTATEMTVPQVPCSLPLGEAYLRAGRLEEAHTLAERTLALTSKRQQRGYQAYALHLLGEIAARHDPLADRTGRSPLPAKPSPWLRNSACARSEAHCHRPRHVISETASASRPYCAVYGYRAVPRYGDDFWLPQAEAALAQVT